MKKKINDYLVEVVNQKGKFWAYAARLQKIGKHDFLFTGWCNYDQPGEALASIENLIKEKNNDAKKTK